MTHQSNQHWVVLDRSELIDAPPWLNLSVEKVRIAGGRIIDDYYHLDIPDFVVVYAETLSQEVIAIRQYKHAVGYVCLTLPGGQVAMNEDPVVAIKRELLEETGYEAAHWKHLGSYIVNGNLGCGKGHFYKASDARKVSEPNSGDLEEMNIQLLNRSELILAVQSGDVALLNHAAIINMALASEQGYASSPTSRSLR
jgi:ADP-ribose pyrophosphatase